MCPVSLRVGGRDVSPCYRVEACYGGAIICAARKMAASSSNIVNGYQDRENDDGKRYEDDEEGLEVSQEEVGI